MKTQINNAQQCKGILLAVVFVSVAAVEKQENLKT